MTGNRNDYMKQISDEEKFWRNKINYLKEEVKTYKRCATLYLRAYKESKEYGQFSNHLLYKKLAKHTILLIKQYRRRLPYEPKKTQLSYGTGYTCRCGSSWASSYGCFDFYCHDCGQRLKYTNNKN